MRILPAYAGLLVLLYVVLSIRTRKLQRTLEAGGDGDPEVLRRRRSLQASLAGYLPIALIVLGLLEVEHLAMPFFHAACLPFLIATFVHAFGALRGKPRLRAAGLTAVLVSMTLASTLLFALGTLDSRPPKLQDWMEMRGPR